jgi:hypothetical protein
VSAAARAPSALDTAVAAGARASPAFYMRLGAKRSARARLFGGVNPFRRPSAAADRPIEPLPRARLPVEAGGGVGPPAPPPVASAGDGDTPASNAARNPFAPARTSFARPFADTGE